MGGSVPNVFNNNSSAKIFLFSKNSPLITSV